MMNDNTDFGEGLWTKREHCQEAMPYVPYDPHPFKPMTDKQYAALEKARYENTHTPKAGTRFIEWYFKCPRQLEKKLSKLGIEKDYTYFHGEEYSCSKTIEEIKAKYGIDISVYLKEKGKRYIWNVDGFTGEANIPQNAAIMAIKHAIKLIKEK